MTHDPQTEERPVPSPAERHIARSRVDERQVGRLPDSSIYRERTLDAYVRGAVLPRFMARLNEIGAETRRHREELAEAYAEMRAAHAGDPQGFASAWRALAARWSFGDVNDLIRTHNEWYPVERQLPMDPRTGEYVLIAGRSYRRAELDARWVLAHFPPVL